jgi:predicted HTH domain antitoxin
MRTVTLDLPDTPGLDDHRVKMLLAGTLYEQGMVTLGQAAQVAGLTKRTFIELMGKFGFSPVSGSVDDLHDDIANA